MLCRLDLKVGAAGYHGCDVAQSFIKDEDGGRDELERNHMQATVDVREEDLHGLFRCIESNEKNKKQSSALICPGWQL